MNSEKTFYSLIHKDMVHDLAVSVFVELQFKCLALHFQHQIVHLGEKSVVTY